MVDPRALPLVRGGLVPHVGDAYVVEEMVCRSLRRLPELGQTPERITALAGRAGHSAGVEHSCPEPPVVRPNIDDVLEGFGGGPLPPSFRREVNALGLLLCGVDAWLPVGDLRRQQQQLSTCSAANPSTIIESTSVEECIYIYTPVICQGRPTAECVGRKCRPRPCPKACLPWTYFISNR